MVWGTLESARQHLPTKNYTDLDRTHRELLVLSSYVSEPAKLNSKKFEQVGEILKISPIWEDGYRLLHLNDDIVFTRPMCVSQTRIFFGGTYGGDIYSEHCFELFTSMS